MMEDRGPQVQEDSPAQDQPRAQPDHASANGNGGAPAVVGAADGAPAEQSLMQQLLDDPEIFCKHVRAFARPNCFEGVGAAEAPRGTLFHHYKIDEQGLIRWVNLVIATGHNSLAMNRSILQVARHFVRADRLEDGMLNRVEAVIRTYDPCLSCSTHAAGQMALRIQLLDADGQLLDEVSRP